MLFTGVDVVEGQPDAGGLKNSWGDGNGVKGYYTMNDNWFDEYMFEVAAPAESLTETMREALKTGADSSSSLGPNGIPARSEAL